MKKPKIAFGLPAGPTLETEMALSMMQILARTRHDIKILWQSGSQISMIRNNIVKDALEWDATHIYWQDSDIIAPANTITELLKHDKHIVGAAYCKKVPPYELTGGIDKADGRLKPAKRMPGGCMLVKMYVYEKMGWPWYFEVPHHEEMIITSEDYGFSDKAIASGFDIWCDIDITQRLGHIGRQAVRLNLPDDHPDKIK